MASSRGAAAGGAGGGPQIPRINSAALEIKKAKTGIEFVHASSNCASDFASLAKHLTDDHYSKDNYIAAHAQVKACVDARDLTAKHFKNKKGTVDWGHEKAIQLVQSLETFTKYLLETKGTYDQIQIQFEDDTFSFKIAAKQKITQKIEFWEVNTKFNGGQQIAAGGYRLKRTRRTTKRSRMKTMRRARLRR